MENSVVVPQKMKHRITIWSSNSSSKSIPKRIESRDLNRFWAPRFIAALLTIAKGWEQSRCLPPDEWINTMWYIHTIEYYSALKRSEFLTHATLWMDFEGIVLSNTSQSQKGWRRRKRELLFNRYRVSIWENELILEMDGVMVAQQCEYT